MLGWLIGSQHHSPPSSLPAGAGDLKINSQMPIHDSALCSKQAPPLVSTHVSFEGQNEAEATSLLLLLLASKALEC